VPVIASGGVGTLDHLADGIQQGGADAVLAASIFHYGEFTVHRPSSAWPSAAFPCASELAAAALPIRIAAIDNTAMTMAMNFLMSSGTRRAGAGDRAGAGHGRRADVRLDEPRSAGQKTVELGRAVYFSRSRNKLWFKGEESGHVQTVHEIRVDCDNDVLLLKVTQSGA
jgi:hypothetical protein